MERLSIWIGLGNAVMQDSGELSAAVAKVAKAIDRGAVRGTVSDINGNTVGEWDIEDEERR